MRKSRKINCRNKMSSPVSSLFLIVAIALITLATATLSSALSSEAPWNGVMPWLCTERCNQTKEVVMQNIQSILDHQHILSRVCFERYNLGPNGSLVINNDLTNPNPIFKTKASNLKTIAMISSYPYPKDFIIWMRSVFTNTLPFLKRVLAQIQKDNIDGVNIDWEPTTTATAQDANDYATFLGIAAAFFTSHNKIFSVDFATWSSIWNVTEISSSISTSMKEHSLNPSLTPMMCDMGTYTYEDKIWMEQLDIALSKVVERDLLVVGLQALPQTNVAFRFDALKKRKLCKAAVWKLPMNETWWNAVGDFVRNC